MRANVRWVAPTRAGRPARDGETDVLVVDPDRGALLAIEVKDGPVGRDSFGRWYAGNRKLEVSPFEQAETGAHALGAKVTEDRRWRANDHLRELHAVAFPDVDRATLTNGRSLGPDAPLELVLDRSDLADADATRRALDRLFGYWSGDGSRDRMMTPEQLAVVDDVLAPTTPSKTRVRVFRNLSSRLTEELVSAAGWVVTRWRMLEPDEIPVTVSNIM